jgi:hypothetical protein
MDNKQKDKKLKQRWPRMCSQWLNDHKKFP